MLVKTLDRVRNIGIIAHIDAGKTTTTERFLYTAGIIHKMGEVHDGEATMDFRADERERGITISAAAITFLWRDHQVNLIDTPGHVDFTAEVERSLRVLDGAVVIFSGVEGVEPQSETVWHQADHYGVPRLAFINKLDRVGADHERVLGQVRKELGANAVFINLPDGLEDKLGGVIDLIAMKHLLIDPTSQGKELIAHPIPDEAIDSARATRETLIERLADVVEWFGDLYLAEQPIGEDEIRRALRQATIAGRIVPVMCGASLRDLGVAPVLDAVTLYLPSPVDRPAAIGSHPDTHEAERREPSADAPFSALVFKVVASPNTEFTWLRVYSGKLTDEDRCFNPRTGSKLRLRQLLRLHADKSERVEVATCGDIVAVPALKDVTTGDTLCDASHPIAYEPIQFPETVVSVAVEARTSADREKMLEVIEKLQREDPTFRCHTDSETGQLILFGMGELHLEVLRDRMLRDFNISARFGKPRVSYRETVSTTASGDGIFDKKIGETQVHARARVRIEPRPRIPGERTAVAVETKLLGTASMLTPQLQREAHDILRSGCEAGGSYGYPVVDVEVVAEDLSLGDAPDLLVPLGASLTVALRHALQNAGTVVLEPIMRLEVRVPEDFLGPVVKDLGARRTEIRETAIIGNYAAVRGYVPLAEMFGYSTDVRSLTQGRGSFSMEPFDYRAVPTHLTSKQHTLL
ncbi:MAG: elongation factor G [Acidobacteriota bacterium]